MDHTLPITNHTLTPTDVSQFIRLERCERYLRLRMYERSRGNQDFLYEFDVQGQDIPPMLGRSGASFEAGIVAQLAAQVALQDFAKDSVGVAGKRHEDNERVVAAAQTLAPGERQLIAQPRLREQLGSFAVRLLRGLSHDLLAGHQDTFVFLLDMNKVFEAFVTAALEARFGGAITTQQSIGTLLKMNPGGIQQKPDLRWAGKKNLWIGDAKYKHLTAGMEASLTFAQDETAPAGRFLSPDDIRQLTVYAELVRRKNALETIPHLALFYPFQGSDAQLKADAPSRGTTPRSGSCRCFSGNQRVSPPCSP